MKCITMSYKGFEFPVNVKSINASFSKRISNIPIPKKSAKSQEICFNPAVIKGEGCFVGEGANEKAQLLITAFRGKGSAYLFSPIFSPIKAYFSDLKLSADSEKNCIEFSFTFTEDATGKKRYYDFGYTFALPGENLFDIANRCDVSPEKISKANDFKDMFSVSQGDKVWLN